MPPDNAQIGRPAAGAGAAKRHLSLTDVDREAGGADTDVYATTRQSMSLTSTTRLT